MVFIGFWYSEVCYLFILDFVFSVDGFDVILDYLNGLIWDYRSKECVKCESIFECFGEVISKMFDFDDSDLDFLGNLCIRMSFLNSYKYYLGWKGVIFYILDWKYGYIFEWLFYKVKYEFIRLFK